MSYELFLSIFLLGKCLLLLSVGVKLGHSYEVGYKSMVSENGALRRTFGSKEEETKGGWRKLRN
jgi:hypothetical protein